MMIKVVVATYHEGSGGCDGGLLLTSRSFASPLLLEFGRFPSVFTLKHHSFHTIGRPTSCSHLLQSPFRAAVLLTCGMHRPPMEPQLTSAHAPPSPPAPT